MVLGEGSCKYDVQKQPHAPLDEHRTVVSATIYGLPSSLEAGGYLWRRKK